MAVYIDRETVKKTVQNVFDDLYSGKIPEEIAALMECIMVDIGIIPAIDVQPVNQWISCQDKMPEEYKTVLVYEKDYGVMIGELEKKFFDTQYFIARKSGLILRTTEVTHWQPLPEPPKDGD